VERTVRELTTAQQNDRSAPLCLRSKPPAGIGQHGESFARCLQPALLFLVLMLPLTACNPFAPAIDNDAFGDNGLISDQTTVEGLFQNFRYAYTFKDTTIYGGLLAHDFTFTYRDYERNIDESWGRDEEMRITWHLFQSASNLNLVWNNVVGFSGDSLRSSVTRGFNLTVNFNPSDVVRVDGRVSLDLSRSDISRPWRISQWRDESNY
jgi:hypothetical protein